MINRLCLDCRKPGPWGRDGRCTEHRLARQRAKDKTPARRAQKAKYGHEHQQHRKAVAAAMATGVTVHCWRCGDPITGAWHLGHRPGQESAPEHQQCNLRFSNEFKEIS